jgi:hypothetical protein
VPLQQPRSRHVLRLAATRPATNKETFRLIYDPDDTADMLGWHEIVYADGFVATIPIRYGVNISE